MNTHNLTCDFGRHKGTLYTRMPISYLQWMINSNHSQAKIAAAELERRGTTTPSLDISGHAIDRASLRLLSQWREEGAPNDEGLNSWLSRVAAEALEKKIKDNKGCYLHNGIKFVFEEDGVWPVLKTVMRG